MLPTGKITEPYVQQHEDGRWMFIAPTADPKTSCCATYCEKEDEADELMNFWKEGFRVARARFQAPGATHQPDRT